MSRTIRLQTCETMEVKPVDLDQVALVATKAAKEAGDILMSYWSHGKSFEIEFKE